MRRRGFSMIELLIVVAIVVALGAVVSASLLGWGADARFEEASRRVESAFVIARADALREGRALAIMARPDRGRDGMDLVLETFDPEGGSEAGARPSRRLVALPDGVRVVDRLESQDGAGTAAPGADAAVQAGAGGSVRLCVMLPDGGAWASAPVYLVGPGDRAAKIGVNRWTGTARIEVVEARERAEAAADEEAELPPETGDEAREKGGE